MDPRIWAERWGRRRSPTPELASALGDLDRLGVDRPELAAPAAGLRKVLLAAFLGPEEPAIIGTDLMAMAAGWSEGRPAFRSHRPKLYDAALNARSRRVARALGPDNEAARAFLVALRRRRIELSAWVEEVLAGRPEEVARRAHAIGLDPSTSASILRMTLLPSLARFSAGLDRLRPEGAWDRGDCPNCGSRPLLAESRGLEQRIFYRCGLCAGDWAGERLRCPSCGEDSPRARHHSFVEGEQDRYRLAHCDACRYDWKVVSTLTAPSAPAMIVADLATVHLDLLADARRGDSP